jgi:hypothetical protein
VTVEDGGRKVVYIDDRGVTVTETRPDRDRDDDEGDDRFRPRPPARVTVDGLPVPVVPGTRVTDARIEPPAPPAPPRPPKAAKPPRAPKVQVRVARPVAQTEPAELRTVAGRLSATEERARKDARARLDEEIAKWLAPDVPRSWKVPGPMVSGLIREVRVAPRDRDYGTLYEATMRVDLSPARRAGIVAAFRHEKTVQKLTLLGGLLAFVLICLATLSGYIRADEATRGYYTNRLRLAAAAGVGAAGVLIYQWLT